MVVLLTLLLVRTICQEHEGKTTKTTLCIGTVVGWDPQENVPRYIQDPKYHTNGYGNSTVLRVIHTSLV